MILNSLLAETPNKKFIPVLKDKKKDQLKKNDKKRKKRE